MNNLIFLDTETTGISSEDRLFQVAYIFNDKKKESLFKPPLPISIEASEVTHYTNKDVENLKTFSESEYKKELTEILKNPKNIFIAHNAKFDIKILEKENIKINDFIDTYKIAQFLDPEVKLGAYRLQYLRYALNLNTKGASAHDAMGDVIVLKSLFERLYKKMKELHPKNTLRKMIQISKEPQEIKKINFGKHKGKFVADVAKEDIGYLQWLLKQKELDAAEGNIDEDWIFTLKKYL